MMSPSIKPSQDSSFLSLDMGLALKEDSFSSCKVMFHLWKDRQTECSILPTDLMAFVNLF